MPPSDPVFRSTCSDTYSGPTRCPAAFALHNSSVSRIFFAPLLNFIYLFILFSTGNPLTKKYKFTTENFSILQKGSNNEIKIQRDRLVK